MNNLEWSTKKLKTSILSPQEPKPLKPNQPTNVSNKPIIKPKKIEWEAVKPKETKVENKPKILKPKPSDILKSKDWNNLADNVEQLKTKVEWWNMVPSGWVLAFYLESCPAGWKAADGSNNTPDLRWKFIRWLNNFNWTNWLLSWDNSDEDRWNSAWLWSYQEDAIRNITGTRQATAARGAVYSAAILTGAFKTTTPKPSITGGIPTSGDGGNQVLVFDASLVVPTWKDNRPKNVWLIYCVKE